MNSCRPNEMYNADDECDGKRTTRAKQKHLSFGARCVEALKFGFVEMMEDIGKWLVVGLIVAGLITVLVPDEFFDAFKNNTTLSMLLVLCVSVPMYICATGSIPIAVVLMMKGLTPGAALVMLMAGPACNVASILVVNKVLGKKVLFVYLAAIVGGAMLFGYGIDWLLPREWFTGHLMATHSCAHDAAGWFEWLCTGVLSLLLLNVLLMRLRHKHICGCANHDGCHCDGHAGGSADVEVSSEITTSMDGNDDCVLNVYTGVVKGMSCNHCRMNVEKAIRTVEGVQSVTVDLHSGRVAITGNNVDEKAVRSAVESIGFSLSLFQ